MLVLVRTDDGVSFEVLDEGHGRLALEMRDSFGGTVHLGYRDVRTLLRLAGVLFGS